ncbi:MAG: hypothetical protein Q9219_006098 [cf. Caloplaca sp. 3 TL-2023]
MSRMDLATADMRPWLQSTAGRILCLKDHQGRVESVAGKWEAAVTDTKHQMEEQRRDTQDRQRLFPSSSTRFQAIPSPITITSNTQQPLEVLTDAAAHRPLRPLNLSAGAASDEASSPNAPRTSSIIDTRPINGRTAGTPSMTIAQSVYASATIDNQSLHRPTQSIRAETLTMSFGAYPTNTRTIGSDNSPQNENDQVNSTPDQTSTRRETHTTTNDSRAPSTPPTTTPISTNTTALALDLARATVTPEIVDSVAARIQGILDRHLRTHLPRERDVDSTTVSTTPSTSTASPGNNPRFSRSSRQSSGRPSLTSTPTLPPAIPDTHPPPPLNQLPRDPQPFSTPAYPFLFPPTSQLPFPSTTTTPPPPQPATPPGTASTPPTDGECSICFDDILDRDNLTSCTRQCKQPFHRDCMRMWLRHSLKFDCPCW